MKTRVENSIEGKEKERRTAGERTRQNLSLPPEKARGGI
jgi:hypothetical protein